MRCPDCGVECRVKVVEDDSKATIYFFCRNKNCRDYDPEFRNPVSQKEVPKS